MAREIKVTTWPDDQVLLPHGGSMSKAEVFGWKTVDKPGKFTWLDKSLIQVDHSYQRDEVNESRINRIASELSWVKFGVITVIQRGDKTYWVIDGQHRLLACKKRSDIDKVPVLIFQVFSKTQEAEGFLKINKDRGSVKTVEAFNALLVARDDAAMATQKMVEASGYKLGRGNAKKTARCVAAIYNAVRLDQESSQVAWDLCVDLYAGESPIDKVFIALFTLQRAIKKAQPTRSLSDMDTRKIILAAGPKKLLASIVDMATALHKSGSKVFAAGVAVLLNSKLKKGCYVPSLMPGTTDE
jgi:hypothetical protein